MSQHIHSYSKIYHIGHPLAKDLLGQLVIVEEKIDGSQFSMLKLPTGEVVIKSKQVEMDPYNPNGMFKKAAQTALSLDLYPGWVYRGEFLQSPQHNTLKYDRVPEKNIILFDIETGLYKFLDPFERQKEAERLGLEVVPVLFVGKLLQDIEQFKKLLDKTSVLGNEKIEGVVIKPFEHKIFGDDGKVVMSKYVREDFKERNHKNWKENVNPGKNMIIEQLIAQYETNAAKSKALQRLREADELEAHPRDIPKIVREVQKDLHEEWEEEIKNKLYKWALPQIQKGVCRGVPTWYKNLLMEEAFGGDVPEETAEETENE